MYSGSKPVIPPYKHINWDHPSSIVPAQDPLLGFYEAVLKRINERGISNKAQGLWALAILKSMIEVNLNKQFIVQAIDAFKEDVQTGAYYVNGSLDTGEDHYFRNTNKKSIFDLYRTATHNANPGDEDKGHILRTSRTKIKSKPDDYENLSNDLLVTFGDQTGLENYLNLFIKPWQEIQAFKSTVDRSDCLDAFIDNIKTKTTGCVNERTVTAIAKLHAKVDQRKTKRLHRKDFIDELEPMTEAASADDYHKVEALFQGFLKKYDGFTFYENKMIDSIYYRDDKDPQWKIHSGTQDKLQKEIVCYFVEVLGIAMNEEEIYEQWPKKYSMPSPLPSFSFSPSFSSASSSQGTSSSYVPPNRTFGNNFPNYPTQFYSSSSSFPSSSSSTSSYQGTPSSYFSPNDTNNFPNRPTQYYSSSSNFLPSSSSTSSYSSLSGSSYPTFPPLYLPQYTLASSSSSYLPSQPFPSQDPLLYEDNHYLTDSKATLFPRQQSKAPSFFPISIDFRDHSHKTLRMFANTIKNLVDSKKINTPITAFLNNGEQIQFGISKNNKPGSFYIQTMDGNYQIALQNDEITSWVRDQPENSQLRPSLRFMLQNGVLEAIAGVVPECGPNGPLIDLANIVRTAVEQKIIPFVTEFQSLSGKKILFGISQDENRKGAFYIEEHQGAQKLHQLGVDKKGHITSYLTNRFQDPAKDLEHLTNNETIKQIKIDMLKTICTNYLNHLGDRDACHIDQAEYLEKYQTVMGLLAALADKNHSLEERINEFTGILNAKHFILETRRDNAATLFAKGIALILAAATVFIPPVRNYFWNKVTQVEGRETICKINSIVPLSLKSLK